MWAIQHAYRYILLHYTYVLKAHCNSTAETPVRPLSPLITLLTAGTLSSPGLSRPYKTLPQIWWWFSWFFQSTMLHSACKYALIHCSFVYYFVFKICFKYWSMWGSVLKNIMYRCSFQTGCVLITPRLQRLLVLASTLINIYLGPMGVYYSVVRLSVLLKMPEVCQ